MGRIGVLVLVSTLACGCIAECEPLDTRCDGNAAQICNSAGEWMTTMDCDALSPGEWSCCWQPGVPGEPLSEGHTCLTVDECAETDGGE